MIVVIGEPRLAGELVRELLARRIDVVRAGPDDDLPPADVVVVAEGAQRAGWAIERALASITVHGGVLVLATAREDGDPDLAALRRRGAPYTIVRSDVLADVPPADPGALVLVPADLDRAPFATLADLASAVADEIAADRVGAGTTIDVTRRAGAHAWASALRTAGARARVVPAWLAWLLGLFGVAYLRSTDGRVTIRRGTARGPTHALAPG